MRKALAATSALAFVLGGLTFVGPVSAAEPKMSTTKTATTKTVVKKATAPKLTKRGCIRGKQTWAASDAKCVDKVAVKKVMKVTKKAA